MGAEPMDIAVLKQGNSSLSAFVKGIFIGMQKAFNSVRRYNTSHVVLQWCYYSNSVKNVCVCVCVCVVFFVHKNIYVVTVCFSVTDFTYHVDLCM